MDVRVFPFSFPPIRGGAQGGVSPIPDPPAPDDPYNVDNLAFSTQYVKYSSFQNDASKWYSVGATMMGIIEISLGGITIEDNSNVSSIGVDVSDLTWTAGGSAVSIRTVTPTPSYTVANPNDKLKISAEVVGTPDTTIGVSGDVVFSAYDANGVSLQDWTITLAIS